jgi:hypothetical protein
VIPESHNNGLASQWYPVTARNAATAACILSEPIATVLKPARRIGSGDRSKSIGDGLLQSVRRTGLGRPQELLDFRPALLKGMEIGRVGRQRPQRTAPEGSKKGRTERREEGPKGNRRKTDNPQCINRIGIYENHNHPEAAVAS